MPEILTPRGFKRPESLSRIVIGVDPAVTHTQDSDECGIIVAGATEDHRAYILEDLSGRYQPTEWVQIIINTYHAYAADRIVAEVNMGGDLVQSLLHTFDPSVSFKPVRAQFGKHIRAEPVAALYEQRRIFHARRFPLLEEQLCTFDPLIKRKGSPDRLDALVWALTDLLLTPQRTPRIWCV